MNLTLKGPLLIFGGPYSNLEALTAIRNVADEYAIEPDHCICTGDVVAYCSDAQASLEFMKDWGCPVVMGNCEESLAENANDCGCGFDEGSSCDLLSKQWFDYASSQISEDMRVWMGKLPRRVDATLNGYRLSFIHGGMESINKFIFASQTDEIKAELALSKSDLVIGGHCGLPFTREVDGKLWVNAGVIGMPANDGTPKTWYALISPVQSVLEITFHKLDYDYHTTRQKMTEAGLINGYQEALASGVWPSLDVLPEYEKSKTGQVLQLQDVSYGSP